MGKFLGFGVASDVGGDSSKIPHYYISHLIVFKTTISFTGTDHMLLGVFSVPVTPFPTSSEFIEAAVPLTGRFTYQVRSPSQPPSKPQRSPHYHHPYPPILLLEAFSYSSKAKWLKPVIRLPHSTPRRQSIVPLTHHWNTSEL